MTNFEYHMNKIVDLANEYNDFACLNGEIVGCNYTDCTKCDFEDYKNGCGVKKTQWLYAEYKEPITLTAKQKQLLDLLEDGWIANNDGNAFFFENKPHRVGCTWTADGRKVDISRILRIKGISLKTICDLREDPLNIEELRKCKVQE